MINLENKTPRTPSKSKSEAKTPRISDMMTLKMPQQQNEMLNQLGNNLRQKVEKMKDRDRSMSNLSVDSSNLSSSRISNVSIGGTKKKKTRKSKQEPNEIMQKLKRNL